MLVIVLVTETFEWRYKTIRVRCFDAAQAVVLFISIVSIRG